MQIVKLVSFRFKHKLRRCNDTSSNVYQELLANVAEKFLIHLQLLLIKVLNEWIFRGRITFNFVICLFFSFLRLVGT